jgi:conjugal transfer mating pair stabilization protein TraG
MNPTMTVYAYGNVDALRGIFNAVAMVMASGDFADMIRVAVVLGFAVVAVLAAFPGNLGKSWSWFMSVTVLTGVLLVPKADVTIVDKLGQQSPVVVANVPWSLAIMASVKSSIGSTLTEMFETAFQTIPAANVALPAELSYLEHGVMFGSRLVQKSRDAEALSVYARSDLVQYIRNCVFPEQGRAATANTMQNSTDLVTTFSGMNNPALSSSYHDSENGYVRVVANCEEVWAKLTGMLNVAGAEAVRRAAQQALPDLYGTDQGAAITKLENSLNAIYNKAALAGAASSASQIMQQNILINATAEASAIYGASLNDPATMMFSSMRTQAVQQANAGNLVQGRLAEEALPVVRNVTEGILYAVFPVLCILLVASEGKALGAMFKSYVYVLLWVELWPPMFAVVNYLQTLEAAKTMAGAAYLAGGATGLSLGTASHIFSASVSTLATSAWMVTFVPVIAAAVLFGFDKILAITGAAAGGQRAAQSEAAQATKGNLQAGNVSFDQQQLAAYRSDPAMYRTESVGGVEFKNAATGLTLGQYRSATAPVSLSDTAAITRGMAAEASASMSNAQRSGKAADKALDAAFSTALTASQGNAAAASRSLGWDVSKVGSNGLGATDIDETARKIAQSHGIRDAGTVSKALSAGLNGLPIPIVSASGRTENSESLAKEISTGVDSLRKLGSQRKQELVDQFRSSEGFEEVRRSNRDATQRVESSARESQSFRETEQVELARSQQLSAKIEGAERFARESSANWANSLDQYARARFGMSVHDGVADPRKWQSVVTSFIEAGSVRNDAPDGKLMWIPPDAGLGPNAVSPQLVQGAQGVATGGQAGLQGRFDDVNPRGGEQGVRDAQATSDARVAKEQQRLGVRPSGTVSAQQTKTKVGAGQGEAATAASTAAATNREEQGEAQLSLDQRATKVSDFHRPIGSGRNDALDAVRGTDGAERAFSREAEEEAKRRQDAAVQFYSDAKKTVIPTAPPTQQKR